jgi:small subunit ribosomal protein S7
MRGKPASKRKILSDPKYGKQDVAKFINFLMTDGKKSTAQGCVYGAFDLIEKDGKKPLDVFEKAISNVAPAMEVRSRRVGGANYQIPMPVRGERQKTLAYRWIIKAAKSRKGHSMAERLAGEFVDAAEGLGDSVKKKQDVHKQAEANRAFAHFGRRRK